MVQTGSDSKWITSVSHLQVLALMRCLPQSCHRFLGANDSYRAGRSQTGMSTKGLLESAIVENRMTQSTAALEPVAVTLNLYGDPTLPPNIRALCSSHSAGGSTARSNSVSWSGNTLSRMASMMSGARVVRLTIRLT